jgi:hypothetical protein
VAHRIPPVDLTRQTALSFSDGNLVLQVSKPGRYRFELDARDDSVARLRLTRVP